MTCQELSRALGEWLSGELEPEVLAEFREHIEACEDCAHLSAGYRTVAGLGRLLRAAEVPEGVARRVREIARSGRGA